MTPPNNKIVQDLYSLVKSTNFRGNYKSIEENFESIELQGAAVALDSSRAILIEESEISLTDYLLAHPDNDHLGTLDVVELRGEESQSQIEVNSSSVDNTKFHMTFTYGSNAMASERQPEALAVIARAFLLAKISVCKRRLRLTLQQMNTSLRKLELMEVRQAILKSVKEIRSRVGNAAISEINDGVRTIRKRLEMPGVIAVDDLRSIGEAIDSAKGDQILLSLDHVKVAIEATETHVQSRVAILKLANEIEGKSANDQFPSREVDTISALLKIPGVIAVNDSKSIRECLQQAKTQEQSLHLAIARIRLAIEAAKKQKAPNYLNNLIDLYGQVSNHRPSPLQAFWWRLETRIVGWKSKHANSVERDEKEPSAGENMLSRIIAPLCLGILLVLTYLWLVIPIAASSKQLHDALIFAYCVVAVGGLVALATIVLRKSIRLAFDGEGCLICWLLGLSFSVTAMIFVWQYPIAPHSVSETFAKIVHGIFIAGVALAFLSVSLNLRTIKDRIEEKIEGTTSDELDRILSSLTQNSASVAALHTSPTPIGFVPELLFRKFDDVFRTKDAISSLEKVILARKRDMSMRVSHIKEHQQKARRAATAAAGGVFTGFFTFEVGESVFKYMHFQHGNDDRSMFYWFATEAGPFGNPDLKNERAVLPIEVAGYLEECVKKFSNSHKACIEIKKELIQPQGGKFDTYFKQQYQTPELVTYGVLLIITLTVSLVAALIGWRKPAEEQGGGNAGHH